MLHEEIERKLIQEDHPHSDLIRGNDYVGKHLTVEYNAIMYYKDGSTDVPMQTFDNINEAIAFCKEVVDSEQDIITHVELWLQTSEMENGYITDTVGDVVVGYFLNERM